MLKYWAVYCIGQVLDETAVTFLSEHTEATTTYVDVCPTASRMLSFDSYCANVGQQGEDYEAITKKAKDCGASKVGHFDQPG